MEVSEYTKPLTGEMLVDIVDSQYCLWGNRQLIVRPEIDYAVELFVSDSVVMRCMEDDAMREDCWTLASLLSRTKGLPLQSVIRTECEIQPDFKVGFDTEDGFVEVINYSEIQKAY